MVVCVRVRGGVCVYVRACMCRVGGGLDVLCCIDPSHDGPSDRPTADPWPSPLPVCWRKAADSAKRGASACSYGAHIGRHTYRQTHMQKDRHMNVWVYGCVNAYVGCMHWCVSVHTPTPAQVDVASELRLAVRGPSDGHRVLALCVGQVGCMRDL